MAKVPYTCVCMLMCLCNKEWIVATPGVEFGEHDSVFAVDTMLTDDSRNDEDAVQAWREWFALAIEELRPSAPQIMRSNWI